MPTLDVHHLLDLAQRPTGKAHFGDTVRRLVYATVGARRPMLHFLGGETNNYAGWDGWVEVPLEQDGSSILHRSLWELGTDKNAEDKIRRDYKAALKRPLPHGWHRPDVIYVAATLRSLTPQTKQEIKRELIKKHGMPWAGVVILAAGDFVQWIEKYPGVEDWIAIEFQLGNSRFGRALEHSWNEWSSQTSPGLTPALTLAGRNVAPLLAALKFDASQTASLQCDSNEEAVAMVYCAAQALPETDARLIFASALVLNDETSARRLIDQAVGPDSMPLAVLVPPATTQSERFVKAGYRVIHAFGRKEDLSTVITFERAGVQEFAKALSESMGVPTGEAEAQARACGCSVAVWHIRNLFRRPLQPPLPPWADAPHADVVVPAVFLGGWDEVSKPDSAVIKLISGIDASQFGGRLQPFAQGPTPLMEFIGTERFVTAPTAAFEFVVRNITRPHIEKLELACKEVFSRVSPEVAARWAGESSEMRIHRRHEELSSQLLDGLAETLLRIAVLGGRLQETGALGAYSSAQAFVDHLVRTLPGLTNDARLLASLDRQLPYLIEAAPGVFFEALESLIQGHPSELSRLFGDEPGIFGRAFHTGLLWGLEALAWSPNYLPRVAALLLDLTALDPGGQLSNRPSNSLAQIFLAWHPGTATSVNERTEILRQLVDRNPDHGWRLLVELLPGERTISHHTHRPKWRNLGQGDLPPLTRRQAFEAYGLYVALAVEAAQGNVRRLADLVEAYPNLAPEHQSAIERMLGSLDVTTVPAGDLYVLWDRLHGLIAHHRGFADAKWALSADVLGRLEKLTERFVSTDLVVKHRWLFDEQFPETGFVQKDHDGRRNELDARRKQAITDILHAEGWKGVHRLIQAARYSHIVGYVAAELAGSHTALLIAMDSWQKGNTRGELLACQSASAARQRSHNSDWTQAMLSFAAEHGWPHPMIATALLDYPDTKATYQVVAGLATEAQQYYWRNRYAFIRAPEGDHDAFAIAAKALLKHGRAYELVDQDWHRIATMGYQAVLDVLDALLIELTTEKDVHHSGTIGHDVQHLFAWLRKQPEAKTEDIARREYALLPLLTSWSEEASLSLHELMRTDASFFADVVCDLYKAASDDTVLEGEALERAKARANAAYHILASFRTPPGIAVSVIDEQVLSSWIDSTRALLHERDRADVGDLQLGKVLYHTPSDATDGAWPSIPVRKLLQRLKADQIERGIVLENFNSRGTTTRAMFEGGAQERELESKWRGYAQQLGAKWSRSRDLCLQIAEQWRRQAEQEDESAKSQRAQYSR